MHTFAPDGVSPIDLMAIKSLADALHFRHGVPWGEIRRNVDVVYQSAYLEHQVGAEAVIRFLCGQILAHARPTLDREPEFCSW
jgi:hypothetical protein